MAILFAGIVPLACAMLTVSQALIQQTALTPESGTACAGFKSLFDGTTTLDFSRGMLGQSGGMWSPCTHLKTYGLNFAPFFARFLSYQLKPKTALEFGCGLGTTSDFVARQAGANVTCIEPESTLGTLIASLRRDNLGNGQLSQLALNVFDANESSASCAREVQAAEHDLVFTLEVAEHIPAQFRPAMVDFLVGSTKKWLVFSAARPGQGGTGHIDESMLTSEKWREIFEEKGLVFMPNLTDMARKTAYPIRSYDLYANVLVFKHPSNPADDTAEPDDMLGDFMYGGLDSQRAQAIWPTFEERAGVAYAFSEGSNAAMWPSLTLAEQKTKKGIICGEHSQQTTRAPVSFESRIRPGQLLKKPSFESAWAALFYTLENP